MSASTIQSAGTTLDSFDFQVSRPGRTSPYADFYADWFNGKVWQLKRDTKNDGKPLSEVPLANDTQYRAKSESMLSVLRAALKKYNQDGKTEFDSLRAHVESDSLIIQAYKKSAKS